MTRKPLVIPPRASVADDEPLRLAVAAALAFPDGTMTESGLRREASRGNLAVERIAGKDFTTLAAIREMRTRCRAMRKLQGSGSEKSAAMAEGGSARPHGSSATETARSAQAAVATIARALKKRSPTISRPDTAPTPANVIPIGSR